jgi:hypothetical protein
VSGAFAATTAWVRLMPPKVFLFDVRLCSSFSLSKTKLFRHLFLSVFSWLGCWISL